MTTPYTRLRKKKALLAGSLLLLVSAAAADGATKTFQYYRFAPSKFRDIPGQSNSYQLSEFAFYLGGTAVTTKPTVTNPNGNNGNGEVPANLVDGLFTTKMLDFNKQPVVFNFGAPTAIDSYNFATGGDAPERDPTDWVFSGSSNGTDWTPLDIQKNFTVDPGRGAFETAPAPFVLPTTLNPVITTFTSDNAVVLNGSNVFLNWQVDLANQVSISGVGSVPATGSQTVNPPDNALTNYTITGTNTDISASTSSTLTVKTVAGGSVTYRYVRFTPTHRRNDATTTQVQLADMYVVNQGTLIRPTTATNPGGSNAADAGEGAIKATDGDPTTKWLDGNFQPLILDFNTPTTFDSYGFTTANDAADRDPVRWRLEGSNDNTASTVWTLIDNMDLFDFPTPLTRNITTQDIPLPGSSLGAAILSFSTEAPTLVSGQPAILSWATENADSVTIDNGVGTVAVNGTVSVSPTATTTYTLSAKKGTNIVTSQVKVTVITPANSTINYPNFNSAGSEIINLRDSSVLVDATRTKPDTTSKRLRITTDTVSKAGGAWFAKRVNVGQGFDTTFDVSMVTLTPANNPGADGIGFIIQNVGNSVLPNGGEDKGFKAKSFAVNLDSYINDPEPSAATVQLVPNGVTTGAGSKLVNLPTDFPNILGATVTDLTQTTADATPYHVRVTYGGGLMNVYLNGTQIVTNQAVDLAAIGAVDSSGKAYVGFAARTGSFFEAHDITSWTLTEGAPASSGNPLAITASSIDATTGALSLTWSSNTGKTYRITSSQDLTTWTTVVKSGIASGGATTTTTATFTPGTKGFFRVEEE